MLGDLLGMSSSEGRGDLLPAVREAGCAQKMGEGEPRGVVRLGGVQWAAPWAVEERGGGSRIDCPEYSAPG